MVSAPISRMTAAAAVEIGAGSHLGTGQDPVSSLRAGKTAGHGPAAAPATGASASGLSSSFRASWQAVMDTLGSSWHRPADDVQGPDETEASASDAAGSMGKTSPMPSSTTARSTLFLRPVSGQAENLNAGSGARSAAELETETVGLQTGAERPNPARSAKPTQASDSSTTVPAAVLTGSMPAPWSAPVNTTPPVETGAATVRLEMDSKTAMESSDTRQPASGRSTDKAESNGSERANPARSAKPTQTF